MLRLRCSPLLVPLLASLLVGSGCDKSKGGEAVSETPEPSADDASGPVSAEGDAPGEGTVASRELPPELIAELRLEGDDGEGRLLTLGSAFIATAASIDSGAPTYLQILAVRCTDPMHCEVLSETCEGSIARDDSRFALEFHAVEGAPEGSVEACAAYSGTYVLP